MFRQSKRRITGRKNFETAPIYQSQNINNLYKSRLSIYDIPPLEEITLEEFEEWAIDRLKILIEIESCVARNKTIKEIETMIKPLLLKYLPLNPIGKNEYITYQERKKDHYSHFILRLAFCRTEELRAKFAKNELILFKIRYGLLQPSEQKEFIKNYENLPWKYIDNEEKNELKAELVKASSSYVKNMLILESDSNTLSDLELNNFFNQEQFIKIPFENVIDLIASRAVYVKEGNAYIPSLMQLSLLAIEFGNNLKTQLIKTFQSIPRLDEDDRLLPLIQNLSINFSSFEYQQDFNNENSSDINASSVMSQNISKHYPLCVKNLMNGLTSNSHLRYIGRQQLSIFLKAIGLNIDEALKFWQNSFTKGGSMSIEKFNKEYKYNVRHTYGLEGARINYKPWDCGKIFAKPKPAKGEYHGCPYRDFGKDQLVSELRQLGIIDDADLTSIIDDVGKNDYTIACTRVFELSHKVQLNKQKAEQFHINHPNLYYDRSRQLEKAELKKKEVK